MHTLVRSSSLHPYLDPAGKTTNTLNKCCVYNHQVWIVCRCSPGRSWTVWALWDGTLHFYSRTSHKELPTGCSRCLTTPQTRPLDHPVFLRIPCVILLIWCRARGNSQKASNHCALVVWLRFTPPVLLSWRTHLYLLCLLPTTSSGVCRLSI